MGPRSALFRPLRPAVNLSLIAQNRFRDIHYATQSDSPILMMYGLRYRRLNRNADGGTLGISISITSLTLSLLLVSTILFKLAFDFAIPIRVLFLVLASFMIATFPMVAVTISVSVITLIFSVLTPVVAATFSTLVFSRIS